MPKGKIISDSLEQIGEFGASTVKKSVRSIGEILSPYPRPAETGKLPGQTPEKIKSKNHTPLDFKNLGDAYKKNERQQTEALKNRLFQIVRQGDESQLMEQRQRLLRDKRQEATNVQKRHDDEEEKKKIQAGDIPTGKIRQSIFSPRKVAQRQRLETRPSSGKQ